MKILHLSTFYEQGGAARAAGRLHRGLLDREVDSWMLVRLMGDEGKNVILNGGDGKANKTITMLRPYIDALPLALCRNKKNTPWNIAWLPNQLGMVRSKISPDIIHAHWIGTGFLSLYNLSQLSPKIVWTLHDAWPFTGGCHIIHDCTKYREKCGRCPQLGSKSTYDLSWIGWHRKRRFYQKQEQIFIAPSKWIAEQAGSSSLLSNSRIEVIPNGLNTNIFRPIDKQLARKILGLPSDKIIILFGAMSATSDSNKGFEKLKKMLSYLKQSDFKNKIELVVFGAIEPANKPNLGFRTSYLGRFHDDISLAAVYSAADVTCIPSIQESFGQTASEALSCGSPVAAFATSGLLDIIEHGVSGYLAKPYDEMDLAQGIESLVSDQSNLDRMSRAARRRAVKYFDISVVTEQHLNLYDQVISE